MNRTSILLIIILILIVGFGLYFAQKNPSSTLPSPTSESSVSSSTLSNVSGDQAASITSFVTEFGSKLKNVSLLAPAADYKAALQTQYGQYITPELLTLWQANPNQALGRNVSSPWPDRIQIQDIIQVNENTFKVEGNVIEITSADKTGQPAAVYPVTLTVVPNGNGWFIADVIKGAYSELPQEVTVTGTSECLPHTNTSGPQTMECAFGIKADNGKHYALNFSTTNGSAVNFPTGTHMEVTGTLVAKDSLNSNMWNVYPIEGIIAVTNVVKK